MDSSRSSSWKGPAIRAASVRIRLRLARVLAGEGEAEGRFELEADDWEAPRIELSIAYSPSLPGI